MFAQPFLRRFVAVVQVADQGIDDAGRPGALAFRLLVLPRDDYVRWIGDPFLLCDSFPPDWQARGELPILTWTKRPLPNRTVAEIQRVLKRPEGPAFLGGVQALLDGSKLVIERPAPDYEFLRDLWQLLPTSSRSQLWPATYAFGNQLRFDAVVVPNASGPEFAGYLTEQQAEHYPQGRYELNLQIAAEAGDQAELDRLFARRSRAQMWRLGIVLLFLLALAAVVAKIFEPPPRVPGPKQKQTTKDVLLTLPDASAFPELNAIEREQVTTQLRRLASDLKLGIPADASAESLLDAIVVYAKPRQKRAAEDAMRKGPLLRRLRALLWTLEVDDFDSPKLTPGDLVSRLRSKLLNKEGKP
ncbi:MAG: hypothetical protein KatS3mg105_2289 [Gemmatales bacterium]|nr:MAG: hypothetical protein KatS3mg105_2289 [Gemmatales bacterium]